MLHRIGLLVLAVTIIGGIHALTEQTAVAAGVQDPVPDANFQAVADNDPKMNAAIEKARNSVDKFIKALRVPKKNQAFFSIKVAFKDGENVEHMWLSPVTFDGKLFRGTINNKPMKVKTVKFGQKVSGEPSKISDWMFVENKKLVGGFTFRVLRDAMTPEERAKFDKAVPFKIE